MQQKKRTGFSLIQGVSTSGTGPSAHSCVGSTRPCMYGERRANMLAPRKRTISKMVKSMDCAMAPDELAGAEIRGLKD